jgi:glutaconate CoA-transferase, subunit B
MHDYSIDELMSVCIARQVQDGEWLAQGINTPLVMAGLLLAQYTHAPNVRFVSAIGQGLCQQGAALGIANAEGAWLDHALVNVGFATAAAEVLPRHQPKEFFRPAQVDAHGNTNNLYLPRPFLRLPGSGGIADVSVYERRMCLYVPRHSKVTFVPRLAARSGLGHDPARRHGDGPIYCITDLGEFDWHGGHMRLLRYHPHSTPQDIQTRTGFALLTAPDVQPTPPPTADELRLLREVIDPLGVRKLEILGGAARKAHLRAILEAEGAWE